jgi:bidirectional [NiFe] hydrogenase diaphorase subunit
LAERGHPSGDERFHALDATIKRHRFAPDSLIEILHKAQEIFGYLQPDLLYYIAHSLKLPPSRVYGVATFYHLFRLVPKGKHTCVVCTGTACYANGALELLAEIAEWLEIKPGQTTPDDQVSLLTARCLGTCGLAPLAVYDGNVCGHQQLEAAQVHMKGWKHCGSG